MKVTLEFLSLPYIVKIVGVKSMEFDLSGETINDLVSELTDKFGEKLRNFLIDDSGKLDSVFKIFLNKGGPITRNKMDTILHEGDKVTIMMLVAGG